MDTNLTLNDEQSAGLRLAAAQQVKSGANWFYWIGGLSILNTVIAVFGGSIQFLIGLGLNYLMSGIIYGLAGVEYEEADFGIRFLILIVNSCMAAIFFVFGYFSNKRYAWAFIAGMVVYFLDGLVFLIVMDFLSIAFHGLALFFIYKGFQASKNLTRIEMQERIEKAGLSQPIK